jgi:primary-amine oxidase
MCWEIRRVEGLSLSHVVYTPRGGEPQLVLGSGRLAALHVPYDMGQPRYDDIYGMGWVERITEEDCPNGEILKDNQGKPVVCTTSRSRGHAHRNVNWEGDRPRPDVLQGHQFEVFTNSQIGWYNYFNQWKFLDDGTIQPELGATGSLSGSRIRDPKYGWPIGVRSDRFEPNHTHIAYWRLDFDVAGYQNDRVQQYSFSGSGTAKIAMEKEPYKRETASEVSPMRWWRVRDSDVENSDGHRISWEIQLSQTDQFRGPDRESWSHSDIYVTKSRGCERLVQSNSFGSCPRNITDYVNDEKLTDPVVWAGVSYHHVPRDEDEDPMPIHWQGLTIAPRDVTAKSPLP